MTDTASFECILSRQVLRDLAGFHAVPVNATDLQIFSQLLPEIEKIATRKYKRRGSEQNGQLNIRTADVLRYY
jgi:hypothetical protein